MKSKTADPAHCLAPSALLILARLSCHERAVFRWLLPALRRRTKPTDVMPNNSCWNALVLIGLLALVEEIKALQRDPKTCFTLLLHVCLACSILRKGFNHK